MRYRPALVAMVALVTLFVASPASATKPVITPLPPGGVTFEPGQTCEFGVEISTIKANEKSIEFSNGVTLITGSLVQQYTNLATGFSVVENISGPGKFIPQEDGGLTIIATGPQGLALFEGDDGGPALLLIHGQFVAQFNADFTITDLELVGKVVDMCEVLSP